MSNIIIALDIGTTKIAATAVEGPGGKLLSVVAAPNSTGVGGLPSGAHEQEADGIAEICFALLRQLTASPDFSAAEVKTIAISGQMHGVLLADRRLQPLTHLITWCDQRASALTAAIDRAGWPTDRTGCYLHPGYGGATLATLASAGQIPAGATAITIADYVAARLSGTIATGASHAASWGIMNVRQGGWDEELVNRLGIPSGILPEIRPELSVLGTLRVDVGLPPEVTVRLPLGDNQASFIGTCGLDCRAMLLNLGTGGQLSLPCPEFSFRPELETRPLPFGGYLLVGASLCGGRAYAYLKDFFRQSVQALAGRELTDSELYPIMDRLAEAATTELPVDTRFAGTRLEPQLRGRIMDIGDGDFTPGALARGFIHGMVRELTAMVDRNTAARFNHVLVSGNAIRKSRLARQFITAELGLPCVTAENREEAAVGAARAAARAEGWL